MVSVIIPAHDEGTHIGGCLSALLEGSDDGELEVIVVCNGCRDGTASVARTFPTVRVVELEAAGKARALNVGDRLATRFPRVYLDADVVTDIETVRALGAALEQPGIVAASPSFEVDARGCSWAVRSYLSVWQRLPHVGTSLAGRGAYALSAEGRHRFGSFPEELLNDDGFVDSVLGDQSAVLPDHRSIVAAPSTLRELLVRRARVHTGNVQLDRLAGGGARARHGPRDVVDVCRREPSLLPAVIVFLAVTALVRSRSWLAERTGAAPVWAAAR